MPDEDTGETGFEDEDYCYLTTTGRRSGRPHRIEIWFAAHGRTLYLLAGGGGSSDWVRNLVADPAVTLELGGEVHSARARLVEDSDEDELARSLVAGKYQARTSDDLSSWRVRALPVALDLDPDLDSH